jgi:hypothetical protein
MIPQLQRSPGIFVVPDTFPVPSRDSLRGMLDDALHGSSSPEHLKEWGDVIASDNPAKQTIIRFAWLLELQHYWRILQHRHERALYRKATVLKKILAAFFATSQRTIHLDLSEIRRRLGARLHQRTDS